MTTTPFDWLSDLGPAFAAQESWRNGTYHETRIFHYTYHSDGPFAIACGAGLLAEHIRQFRFTPDVIQRMGQVSDERGCSVFHESFLNFLQRMRLRVQLNAAPEGTVLLPGEPLLTVQGPLAQIHLLESAMRLLFWESTHWATQASLERWNRKQLHEDDTPSAPQYPFNPDGWKIRAAYIGGASTDEILKNVHQSPRPMFADEGLKVVASEPGEPLVQIRRLFKSNRPLGDVWLTQAEEEAASVSDPHVRFRDEHTGEVHTLLMNRFQNIYQPVLVKGHPAIAPTRLGYLRQRTLKQLEAFQKHGLEGYPAGNFLKE